MSRLGSQPIAGRRVAIAKPKNDIYVALLGIALGAVIIACILLAMEMSNYEWTVKPKASRVTQPFGALALSIDGDRQIFGPMSQRERSV